jgi:hypothetical protein
LFAACPAPEEAAVPTANAAASQQPTIFRAHHARRQIRRFVLSGLGLVVALSSVFAAETIYAPGVAASAAPGCPGWSSTTQPPNYIRVLRRATGNVQRVPFRTYVVTVMGKEWPSYLPRQVIDAGAVAVKQFAWYHALDSGRVSARGQCYDVTDGTGDQLYKPARARIRPVHYAAVDQTWGVRLMKNGSLFMTGYRTGTRGRCGYDATGWKLYARSAISCAQRGMDYLRILSVYYGPVSVEGRYGRPGAASSVGSAATLGDSSLAIETAAVLVTAQSGAPAGVSDKAPSQPLPDQPEISQNAFTAG